MPVVVAIGVALVLWSIGLSLFYAWLLRRRATSTRPALRSVVRRPTLWLGAVLIVAPFSTAAAVALLVVLAASALVLIARRVSTAPSRRTTDPGARRGRR